MKLRRTGFTLFELLIALAIVVILVGVMASTITIAFKQKQAAEDAIEAVRDLQSVGDLLVQELSSATPPTPSTQSALGGIAGVDSSTLGLGSNGTAGGLGAVQQSENLQMYGPFIGSSEMISFYTTGPEPKAPVQGDSRWIQYGVGKNDKNETCLIRQVSTNLLSDSEDLTLPQEVLIPNVTSVQFLYYDGTQWVDTWDSTLNSDTLPLAVKIELHLAPLRANGEERIIKRVATLWCAAPAASQVTTDQGVTVGLSN